MNGLSARDLARAQEAERVNTLLRSPELSEQQSGEDAVQQLQMRWAAGDTFSGEVLTRLQGLGAIVELNPSSSGESSYVMPVTAYPHLTGDILEEFTRVTVEDEKTRPNINFVAQCRDEGEIKVLYFGMGHHDRVLRQYKEFFGMENLSDIEIVDNYIFSTEKDKLIGGHMLVDAAHRIVSIIIPLNFNRMTPEEVK